MMDNRERTRRKLLTTLPIAAAWTTPVVQTVMLPAHAMTSIAACSSFETETIDQPISLTVSASEIAGPVVAPRTGQRFEAEITQPGALCSDGLTRQTDTIEFSGEIDSATSTITGTFNVRQFCGGVLACEQLGTFVVTQSPLDSNSDLGAYSGRVTGTLRCCRDLV